MASSSSATFVTREEFNAFHSFDRALFTRLVLTLRRDISQSLQVMSFLLYIEKSSLMNNLIVNLVSLPDFLINAVAEEAVMCLSCLSYEDFPTFVAIFGGNVNSLTIPLIVRMTGKQLTMALIHQNRENIHIEMKKHLTRVCYPAFKDIILRAEMYNKEKTIENMMSQLGISMVHNLQGTSKVGTFPEDKQVKADERTIFLTFSRGYPISEAEVHAYFTRRFGDIIEAIHMPEMEGNAQALYATMVLHSAAKIPEIVGGGPKVKFTINGKQVCARKYIPRSSSSNNNNNNLTPPFGVSLSS